MYYKHHEGVYCGLPDGRTYDNEPGSDLSKLENWDRGNISYGKERLYYKDMYGSGGLNSVTFGQGLVNARPHTLILQMDPRNIWNTHRMSMSLGQNASRMYGEYPNKKTYYNGMGGVVGGTDTLSPITYAYANRSDYQKEAGTNFLPCCSRTDGSMSSTCPYPVHDKNFNFQEPKNRYNTLNNYIPGRASFSGRVTISRSGLLPENIAEASSGQSPLEVLEEGVSVPNSPNTAWTARAKEKRAVPIMTDDWHDQTRGTVDSPRAYTEKEFLESTFNIEGIARWMNGQYSYDVYDEWSRGTRYNVYGAVGQGLFGEGSHYNAIGFPKGRYSAYENYDNDEFGSDTGVYGYTIITRPRLDDGDYYYNSSRIEYTEGGTKYNAGASDLTQIPIYGYRFVESPASGDCRGWWCRGGPGYWLWNAWFGGEIAGEDGVGVTGARDIDPKYMPTLPDWNLDWPMYLFGGKMERSGLVYYDGEDDVDGAIPIWNTMMGSRGFTSDSYIVARTKFKTEVDLYERHPADFQSFDRIGAWVGGGRPPRWEWEGDRVPGTDDPGHGPDPTGQCYTYGDALYDEDGNNINGGDQETITMGSCCWSDTRPDSKFYGRKFCFDPWFLNLGTPYNEEAAGFYTAAGYYDPYMSRAFFAKATCDCIGLRDDVEATWYPDTTCMLNDGSIDDAFPTYYEHYLGVDVNINRGFHQNLVGIVNEENVHALYNPSPCGGQYKIWPCDERGPKWWPKYLFAHYPGEQPIVPPINVDGSIGGPGADNSETFRVPEGANTWPDHRTRTLWGIQGAEGLDTFYDASTIYCLKVPDGYGEPGGPQPGDTGPYWIEVGAGDFPWADCNFPWSRHTYDAYDFPGECSLIGGPDVGDSATPLSFNPKSPQEQRAMLAGAGFNPDGDRRELLRAIDSRCEGFLSWYDSNKPTPHDGPGVSSTGLWYSGSYINPGSGSQAQGPGGEAALVNPSPPSAGVGNYGPYPSIHAGVDADDFKATPVRRIRFATWARWREWVPWTNFAPVIMNHIERWIMPGRVENLKKVTIHLPRGSSAFGRGSSAYEDDYSLTRGDLYFPNNISDYMVPLRGMNHGCVAHYMGGTGATAEPEFFTDHVPGHISPQSKEGPNFPYGFDLSGTRKTLNAALRKINEDVEIEWILYPEKDIGNLYIDGGSFATNTGTAQNNAGIFLGEIIYQTCAYGKYKNVFGEDVMYDTQTECLDFLDPTRVCTDYYDWYFPNGFTKWDEDPGGDVDGVPNQGNQHWSRPSVEDRYSYDIWTSTEAENGKAAWKGVDYFTKRMQIGDERFRPKDIHDDLLSWLKEFDIWNDTDKTTLDTPVMRRYHYGMHCTEPGCISGFDVATMPCRFGSGYRPSVTTLFETLEKLHPDLFTAAYDLDPMLRPLKTFNTQKHLVGYYDIIEKDTSIEGTGTINVLERYIEATGPPPLDIRYIDGDVGGASAGILGNMCWGTECRPPLGAYTGMETDDIEVDGGGWHFGHKDWGWGNAGAGATGAMGPEVLTDRYENIILVDVVDWWLGAAFFNETGARDDAIAHLVSQGMHPTMTVWSNNCPQTDGGIGGNFGGWSCDGGNTEWDIGCDDGGGGCDDPNTTSCCGFGLWNNDPDAICGSDPLTGEDNLCVDLIRQGPSFSTSYDIINRFPNLWDTISYSCTSFGTGIMHWADMKSRGVMQFDDPWWENFMLNVLGIIWSTFNLENPDSPWRVENGGCFDFEAGEFDVAWRQRFGGVGGDAYDWESQMTYTDAMSNCYSNHNMGQMANGGLLCRPEDWNLIPQSNSTLWSPNRAEIYSSHYGMDISRTSDIMYADMIKTRNLFGRQLLPMSLEAVTLREIGGDRDYGFGNLDRICDDTGVNCVDLDNELSGLYDPAYHVNDNDLWETVINFEAERDLDRCGPIDSPHPCISRFVRPNTDPTLTDRYGRTVEDYSPLQTSKNGVGKPIEMGSDFSGDGILPVHGYGNTYDIRFAYKVPPANEDGSPGDYGSFDSLGTRMQIIHHTGKQVDGVDVRDA